MDATDRRQPITLYEVPLLPELEVKSLIIKALPQAQLAPQNIILRKKEGKYQAFIMVPPNKVDEICMMKTLIVNKESVTIKKPFTDAQVFIKRIPDTLSIEDIRTPIETEFGKIAKIHEGQPFEDTKSKFWHCYVQFARQEDAEKYLFHPRKIIVKGSQLRPSRAYGMNECDETDKKLFLKVISQYEDQDDIERVLNDEFRKEGKLRDKIRVENGKATITFTSAAVADKVLHNFKGGKIGKYEVALRPYANKDSYTAFVGGMKLTITSQELERTFKHYQPLVSCNILVGNNTSGRNGTLTFGDKDVYSRLLIEYKDDPLIRDIFEKAPYVTPHMSAKDRNEYSQYRKGKGEKKQGPQGPMIPPMSFPLMGPPMQQQQQQYYMPQMGRQPMGNYGMPYQPMP